MSKVVMMYLSNTGNTEKMAMEVQKGIEGAGLDVEVILAEDADAEKLMEFDIIVMGCPASGSEELDENYVEPIMEELENIGLSGKKFALFGSYGWGGGEYMETWRSRVEDAGGEVIAEPVIVEGEPDDVLEDCKALGSALA